MAGGRRRWAIRSTGSSFILLVVAIIAVIQIYPSLLFDSDDYVVKLEPGDSADFELADGTILTALRVNEGSNPPAALSLEQTIYSPVRVFDSIDIGAYTLHNDDESSILWLVDDGAMVDEVYKDPWLYLFYIGCCLGMPVGLVGLILAVMVWTDKRKLPDQFVLIDDGRVVISEMDGMELVREQPTDVPGPFVDSPAEEIEYQPEESDKRWIEWDDG